MIFVVIFLQDPPSNIRKFPISGVIFKNRMHYPPYPWYGLFHYLWIFFMASLIGPYGEKSQNVTGIDKSLSVMFSLESNYLKVSNISTVT